MSIQIKEVLTPKDLKAFIQFPFSLYRGNPYWVPNLISDDYNTLSRDRNPAYEHCQARIWLALRGRRIVGRVAAILNQRHIEKWGQRYLRFGWLDFVDDREVSAALMGAVEDWARGLGMSAVHGPLGFTDLDREGMLVEGFQELGTLATYYNHPYYPSHIEALGYAKDTDWVEYEISIRPEPDPKIARIAELALQRYKLSLLEMRDKNDLLPYAHELFGVLQEAYAGLYGFVPLSERQVEAYIKQYFGFVIPDLVPVVLDHAGKMVGFGVAMPSLSRALQKAGGRLFPFGFIHLLAALRRNDRADLYLVGVRPDYQGKGVNAIIMDRVQRAFNRMGVTKAESNPELEANADVQGQWKYYEKRQHKRRRCYLKEIQG